MPRWSVLIKILIRASEVHHSDLQVANICGWVKEVSPNVPVFAKMTPNVTNIVTIARAGITMYIIIITTITITMFITITITITTTITITMYITIITTNLLSPGRRRRRSDCDQHGLWPHGAECQGDNRYQSARHVRHQPMSITYSYVAILNFTITDLISD